MSEKLDIVFMGTPDFAEISLNKLIENKYNIVGVYTNEDKPKGRGNKLAFPPVKELAIKHDLPVFQPKSLKDETEIEKLKALNPDIIIVVAYGKILPKEVLEIPRLGCVNVHGSLLPKYRGASPIQSCLLEGEKQTGVTTMLMDIGLDTGDMLLTTVTDIGENETASELFDRLAIIGADTLVDTIEGLNKNEITPIKQDDSKSTHTNKITKDMATVSFDVIASDLHNKIRGLSSSPCAMTMMQGKRLKIYKSELPKDFIYDEECKLGEIVDVKNFIVACKDKTFIKFVEVQYEGSKRMEASAFLRGKRVEKGEILGE